MVTIRKAKPKDSDRLASLLLLAMEDIVYTFIGSKDQAKALAFLRHLTGRKNNQYSYQNCWVAEKAGAVMAAINVYDGGCLHQLRAPVLSHIRMLTGRDLQPEDETGAGELYIDTFAVDPEEQGKGIGTLLLQKIILETVEKKKQTLGLLVAADNSGASRFYHRHGFRQVGLKSLLGKPMLHLQLFAPPA